MGSHPHRVPIPGEGSIPMGVPSPGGPHPHWGPHPRGGSRFSPARCTSPRPGRSGGSPGPAARGPPAAGTRPPPSAPGCTSRPARCTPAPAERSQVSSHDLTRPITPAPVPPLPGPVPPPPPRSHLLQPRHGVPHLRVSQHVLRQVADDLREEGGEFLALGCCPRPAIAVAHGAGSRCRFTVPPLPPVASTAPLAPPRPRPPRGARRDAQSRSAGAAAYSVAAELQLPVCPAPGGGPAGTRLEQRPLARFIARG